MKILILGIQGFIGSYLHQYFRQKNDEVYGTGSSKEQLPFYFYTDKQFTQVPAILQQQQFDVCINATGQGDVGKSIVYPAQNFEANTSNVFVLLDAIRAYNPSCKLLNISSAAVYGNQPGTILREDVLPRPYSPYGWHKWISEHICTEFNQVYGIQTCSMRLFSVYGEEQKKQLFWDLWQKCKNPGKKIILAGSGNEERDFMYVQDVLQSVDNIIQHDAFTGGVINAGNGKPITIRHAAETFMQLVDKDIEVSFHNEIRAGDPFSLVADNKKLLSYQYQQAYSLEQGLLNYIQWLKKENL